MSGSIPHAFFPQGNSASVSHEMQGEQLVFTPREAAAFLRISERKLFTLTKEGVLRAKRIGRLVRYYREDLIEFMKRENGNGQHHQ